MLFGIPFVFSGQSMSQFQTIFLSAALGLCAGFGHAILSYHAGLPLSLMDQATQLFEPAPQQSRYF